MRLPFLRRTVSSPYGWRRHPFTGVKSFHLGADFKVPAGSSIRPIAPGVVASKRYHPAKGYTVTIRHDAQLVSKYLHLQAASSLKVGEEVTERTEIGRVGNTGTSSYGAHLHLEVWVDGGHVDPLAFIEDAAR